jgi:hypothetical protein
LYKNQSVAEDTAAALGHLKKSDMSAFQIIAQNSSKDYSYGGFFHTNSKNKTAPITIKLVSQGD